MNHDPVVISGLGAICALGCGIDPFWKALLEGRSGIAPLRAVDPERMQVKVGAEVPDFDSSHHFDADQLPWLDRSTQFALIAAAEALADAGLTVAKQDPHRIGVLFGTGTAGRVTSDEAVMTYARTGRRIHPSAIPRGLPNASVSHISMRYGFKGPALTVNTACASANHAIGQALGWLHAGIADVVVVGGTDAPITEVFMKGWESVRVMSRSTCRPFDRDRDGFVLAEGAAVLVLERASRARARGARPYCAVSGFGFTADAHDLVAPDGEGAMEAMRLALTSAGLCGEDIDYISAHGTGTKTNDAVETAAIRTVFGPHAEHLKISSTKGAHGHALGASGALECAATALAMRHSVAPPTVNYATPDPDCDLDCLPNQARPMTIDHALSNSFAFGGLNAVIALSGI